MENPADLQSWQAVERLSREELLALQLERLRAQVRKLEANPFHGARFRAAGVGAESLRSLDDLRRFPFMTKQDVLADTAEEFASASLRALAPSARDVGLAARALMEASYAWPSRLAPLDRLV